MDTNAENKKNAGQSPKNPNPAPAPPAEVEETGKRSWFGRMSNAFSDALQTSRGDVRRDAAEPAVPEPPRTARPPVVEEAAFRRPKPASVTVAPFPPVGKKMVVPEGTSIGGSVRATNIEIEIAGRIEGDIQVDGRLFLGPTAVVTGNVKAVSCRVEGLVEGKMECAQEIELAHTGRLNSDVNAGKMITVAGQVHGTLKTPTLRLVSTARVEGDVQTRQLSIEEGAVFNGKCGMKPPA